jgi:hypothetical protein
MEEKTKLEVGKIYFIAYGENTQVVGRLSKENSMNYEFYDHLHYWNGYEKFHKGGHCVTSGITEIRRATKPEKHALVRHEIDNDCI